MKIKVIALATFVSAVFAGSAMAYDGTITFTGKVVAQTCTVNTSDKDLAVTLPTVATSSLKDNAATSGLTPFAIRLTGCATGMNSAQNVKAYFEPSSNIDLATHNLKNTATPTKADNVQIQLLNSNGTSTILFWGKRIMGKMSSLRQSDLMEVPHCVIWPSIMQQDNLPQGM